MAHAGLLRGDDAAIGTARLFGEPVENVAAGDSLGGGFRQHLALLDGGNVADVNRAFAHQLSRAMQDRRTFECGGRAPLCKRPVRRRQGVVKVGNGGDWQAGDDLFGRGIDHRDRIAIPGGFPFAGDEQAGFGILKVSHILSPEV